MMDGERSNIFDSSSAGAGTFIELQPAGAFPVSEEGTSATLTFMYRIQLHN